MRSVRSRRGFVLIGLAFAASLPGAAWAEGPPGASFAPFWIAFQEAVRADDAEALAPMAHFPLAVNGESDGDEVRHVAADGFKQDLPRWLDQNSGLSETPQTVRELILETEAAAILARGQNRRLAGRAVRFSSFFFERQGETWRLTRVYEER